MNGATQTYSGTNVGPTHDGNVRPRETPAILITVSTETAF